MKANLYSHRGLLVVLSGVCLLAALSGQAAIQFYSGASANKTWDTNLLDWAATTSGPYNAAWLNGNDAIFEGTSVTVTNSGVSAHSLTFSVANYVVASNTITLTGTTPTITNGVDATVSAGFAGTAGFNKTGVGTLTLSGSNALTGNYGQNLGTVNVTGSHSQGTGVVVLNPASGSKAIMNVTGSGSVTVSTAAAGNGFSIGTVAGGVGVLNVNTAGAISTGQIGNNNSSSALNAGTAGFGAVNLTSGTLNLRGFLVAGITTSGAVGIWNINGGQVNILGDMGGTVGATAGTTGVLNITAGSYTAIGTNSGGNRSGIYISEAGTGTLNISGSGSMNLGDTTSSQGLNIGRNNVGTSVGTVNLGGVGSGGGSITTTRVFKGGGLASGVLNFHGGTLRAKLNNATFMQGLSSAYVFSEGGTIDNNGKVITVGQSLLTPSGSGVASIAVSGGTGYIATPLVTITGGGGTRATAVASIDSNGNLTGITMTNPGNDYTSTPTVTITGGGGSGATVGTITLAANVSGGMIFTGSGTNTIAGAGTYSGGTTINGGTLVVSGFGTLGASTGALTNNGGTLNLGTTVQSVGAVAINGGVISNGTLSGASFTATSGTVLATLDGVGATLNKTGSGVLTLKAANTHSGNTTVSGGKLSVVTGSSCNNSAVRFTPGAGVSVTNELLITTPGGQWSCGSLTNTAGSGTIYADFDFGTVSGPSTTLAPLVVNGDCAVSGNLDITVRGGLGWASGQTYPLVQIFGASAPASITLTLVGEPAGVTGSTVTYDAINKVINYNVGSAPQPLTWVQGNGAWDINTSTNWINATPALSVFKQFDLVTFDDTPGSGPFTVTGNTTVTPSSITVANNTADYTITGSGSISGTTAFSKSGAGSLTLATANSYSGGTVVSAGTLKLANAAALGSGTLTIDGGALDSGVANLVNANPNPITLNNDLFFIGSQNLNLGGGAITFSANRSVSVSNNTLTVSGLISAPGQTLTKNGPGTLRQGAANSLGGVSVVIDEGAIDLNGSALGVDGFSGASGGTVLNNAGSGQATFTFGNGNGGGEFNGTVTDNSTGSGTVAVTKVGLGLVTWNGSNSYSGPTFITTAAVGGAGCLFTVTHPNAFGNSIGEVTQLDANSCVQLSNNVTVANKTINLVGTGGSPSNTGGGLNGNGSLQGASGQTNTWAGIVRMGASTTPGRFGVQAGTPGVLNISGSIRDGLTATGAGLDIVINSDAAGSVVMFSAPAGVNTYTGSTVIGRGILKIGANNSIPAGSLLNIGTAGSLSGTFDLNGFDQTVGGLAHTGANTATLDNTSTTTTNTLTINQSTTQTYSGAIAGNTALNLVKSGTGQLTLTGNNSGYAGITTVSNGTLLVNSALGTSDVTVNGGTLGGIGTISGAVVVNSGGTLSPGSNSIATLTINNTLSLAAGSTTSVQVNKTLVTADQVSGLSTVTYGGTLVATNLSGTLTTNDTFTLFSASTHVGNFSSISGSPGVGLAWSFSNGILSVVEAVPPTPTNITYTVTGNQLVLNWPAGQGWKLQAQTNSLTSGINTNWTTVSPVPVPPLTNNINPANPTVFYRLVYP